MLTRITISLIALLVCCSVATQNKTELKPQQPRKPFSHKAHEQVPYLKCQDCHAPEMAQQERASKCLNCHSSNKPFFWNELNYGQKIDTMNYFVRSELKRNIDSVPYNLSFGDTIKGDFNGDGKFEYLWVVNARDHETMECVDKECKIKLKCSDKNIPEIITSYDYDTGFLYNEGDLNNDGTDEISFIIHGDGSWGSCHVYSFKNKKWYEPVKSFALWDGLGDENIKIDINKPGNVIIKEWHGGDSIYVETRSEPVMYYKKSKK